MSQGELKEHTQSIAELREWSREQSRSTDQAIKELASMFSSQWGTLIEALVEPGCIAQFKQRGIPISRSTRRAEGIEPNGRQMEIDVLLIDGRELVAIEVKLTMKVSDVDENENRLARFIPTLAASLLVIAIAGCCATAPAPSRMSDDALLDRVQQETIAYFWDGAEPVSGLARERIHMDGVYPQNDQDVITSGGSGFGVMALLVGIERGWIARSEALERFERIVNFLETADRFYGVYPHWWHGPTGKVKPFSRKDDGGDVVETAFLMQGLLCVRQYFADGTAREQAIAQRIDQLWRDVEWNWHTQGGQPVLYWHWSPNYGWEKNHAVQGYNECLILYILAAASPTYPIDPAAYHSGWARDGAIAQGTTAYGYPTVVDHNGDEPVGPLFWAHYSHLGLNPRGLRDRYADYWVMNQNHARIHHAYCVDNPEGFKGYGDRCWGLTSSYSPRGYAGHKPGRDLGVISPTAALSSFPYTPAESLRMLRFLYQDHPELIGPYGPYDAFSFEHDWHPPRYLAIDQGPIPVMIENHRTGLLWNLFMSCEEVQTGLQRLGFAAEPPDRP